jgi:hypothetical protein
MEVKNTERQILKNVKPGELRVNFLMASKGQFGPLYTIKYGEK